MFTSIDQYRLFKESLSVPNREIGIVPYIRQVIGDRTEFNEICFILNQARSNWSDSDLDNALEEACYGWNTSIGSVLRELGFTCKIFEGTPLNDELPEHYITICNTIVFDFVAGQFWGYGLGNNFDNDDKVTYTQHEYTDILKAYSWKKI